MGDKTKGGTPLEFFLWRRGDKAGPGLSAEKTVQGQGSEENLIGDALRVFNARTRTVRRSSGGLSVAEPYQMVFFDPTEPGSTKPEVRIKVRFKDFKVSRTGELTNGELVTHTKVVLPSELGEAFSYDLDSLQNQTFVVDFGLGIVPIHVVDFRTEGDGNRVAYFIELDDYARLLRRDSGGALSIQLYRVDRDVVRHAEEKRTGGSKSEWEVARENYADLIRKKATVVPTELACGAPVSLASGKTPKEVRQAFQKNVRHIENPEVSLAAKRVDTGEMVPFGVFER